MQTHKMERRNSERQLSLPRWLRNIRLAAIVAFAVVTLSYFFSFHGPSGNQATWGQFGDFLGGTLNPVLTFLTFMALLYTIVLQGEQLKHAEKTLKITERDLHQQALDSSKQLTASILLGLRQIYSTDEMNGAVSYLQQLRRDNAAELKENPYSFARKYLKTIDSNSMEWVMRRRVSHFYADAAALVEAGCVDPNQFFLSYGSSFEIIEFLEPIETAIAERLDAMPYNGEWVALRLLLRGREWQQEQQKKGIDPQFTLPRDPALYAKSQGS